MSGQKQRLQDMTRHNLLSTHIRAYAHWEKGMETMSYSMLRKTALFSWFCSCPVSAHTYAKQRLKPKAERSAFICNCSVGLGETSYHYICGKIELWFHLNNSLLKWMAINFQVYEIKTNSRHDEWLVTKMQFFIRCFEFCSLFFCVCGSVCALPCNIFISFMSHFQFEHRRVLIYGTKGLLSIQTHLVSLRKKNVSSHWQNSNEPAEYADPRNF